MKMPRFLLYGISGTYNYGCEAIVRGTEILLREIWPEAIIRYASRRPEEDAKRLEGSNIEIVRRVFYRRYSLRNIVRKACSILGMSWSPAVEKFGILDDIDVVLSIGGDLYSIRPKGRYADTLVKFGEAVLKSSRILAIWGASVGPLEQNQRIKRIYVKHLKKASLITSREPESTNYLKSIGLQDLVVQCADPAFVVTGPPQPEKEPSDGLCIGINFSPMSTVCLAGGEDYESFIPNYAEAIRQIMTEFDANILLIPHVIAPHSKGDDDSRFLKSIMLSLQNNLMSRIQVIDNNSDFIGTKIEMAKCDLIIAARMHCAINAVSAFVPTLLVSYSRKSIGMAKFIYGHERWVVALQHFISGGSLDTIREMLSKKEEIRHHLKNQVARIQGDARRAAEALRELLSSKKVFY